MTELIAFFKLLPVFWEVYKEIKDKIEDIEDKKFKENLKQLILLAKRIESEKDALEYAKKIIELRRSGRI